MDRLTFDIFRRGSVTFFTSSLFFPARERADVFALYAFVRQADDLVDTVPPRLDAYRAFRAAYLGARSGQPSGSRVVDGFVALQRRHGLEPDWIEAFFEAMDADVAGARYERLEDVERYMYGSAEVVGLMMARILDLPASSDRPARLLGRAFQYINMIRDVEEDRGLGRVYLPEDRARSRGLAGLDERSARANPRAFAAYMREQIKTYRVWRAEAAEGFPSIPSRCRVAIAAAADMYDFTAERIERDPFVVFRRKVKPSRARVVVGLLRNGAGELARPWAETPVAALEDR